MADSRTILGVDFDLVSYADAVETVAGWNEARERHYVCLTNPHSVMMCRRDPEMAAATAGSGLVLPDGVGIPLAARILGYEHHGRVTGPTLMLELCDKGRDRGLRHFFYGGAEGVPERLRDELVTTLPGLDVVGTYSPPFRELTAEEDRGEVERINATGADIVWIGLGAPKQEKWMAAHAARVEACAMIGVGAAFDFHSGNVPWAPEWVRKGGVEWAYRLLHEPGRLWRRNLDSPRFLAAVIWSRLTATRGEPASGN